MSKSQTHQQLAADAVDRLPTGDPDAAIEQKLVSAQNAVVVERAGYTRALSRRADCITLAQAAGWSKYRIAKRLGITRRAVDEALTRTTRTPAEILAADIRRNGGHENRSDQRIRELLATEGAPRR